MKVVQPNLKMKNLSEARVQSITSHFVNNLTNFEGVVKNVWQHESVSFFNINRPSSQRWRYSIGLLFRTDWWNSSSTTYGSSFCERHGENTLFFYSEPTFKKTPTRKVVYLRLSSQMMTRRCNGYIQLRGTINISLA